MILCPPIGWKVSLGPGGNDSFTKLLLHCDGTDGSTTFTDSSAGAKTVTANGNAQIDTAQSKFGGASGLFDGTGDYLTISDHADFHYAAGDFTIDFWVRFNALPGSGVDHMFISQSDGTGDNHITFFLRNSAGVYTLFFYAVTGNVVRGSFTSSAISPSINTWYHYAVERNGSNTNFYVDGTKLTTTVNQAWGTVGDLANTVRIANTGGSFGAAVNGWLDEFRISKGIARYQGSNFTPPAVPYA